MKTNCLRRMACVAGLLLASAARGGEVRYVDDDAALGGDGLSWPTAYRYLVDALAEADDGSGRITEIRVAQGTYLPDRTERAPQGSCTPGPCTQQATFRLLNGLTLRGGYAGLGAPDPDARDINAYQTRLSGDLDQNDPPDGPAFLNSYHVLTADATVQSALLDGLFVSGGSATSSPYNRRGGGLYALGATFDILDCSFSGNRASDSGGGESLSGSHVELSDCTFEENLANRGGAFDTNQSTIVARGCRFTGNHVFGPGGAIYAYDSYGLPVGHVSVVACEFVDNHAQAGGAVFLHDPHVNNDVGRFEFVDCVFLANAANGSGGALSTTSGGNYEIVNCLFSGNSANDHGGAIVSEGIGAFRLRNCTICANHAGMLGGGVCNGWMTTTVANSIVWQNTADGAQPGETQIKSFFVPIDVRYSCVQEGWSAGPGNVDTDPLFIDPSGPDGIPGTGDEDLRPGPGSPVIDAGHDWAVLPDYGDLDGDGNGTELTPYDLDGNARFVQAPAPDLGCGSPAIVDMGAYEFQTGKAAIVRLGDVDGDGLVSAADLAALLDDWGPCVEGCCLSDLDMNGAVNVIDFLALLEGWGG